MYRESLMLCATLLAVSCAMLQAAPTRVSQQQAHDWLLNVIPHPQQVTIPAKLVVPVSDICILLDDDPAVLYANQAKDIAARLEDRCGAALPPPQQAQVVLVAGTMDEAGEVRGYPVPWAERLRGLKNADQAYSIHLANSNTLVVAGAKPAGVYYGLLTLWHLVRPTIRQEGGEWLAAVPLCEVLDWPDLAERGEWGGSVNRDIEWLADCKMNLCESHCQSLKVTPEGKGVAEFDMELIARGATCAVKVVPIITHLDQLGRTGLFDVFEDTLGEGDPSTWPYGGTTVKPACFSNPKTARALADWMVSLATQPQITDFNIWLSEHHVSCACEKCKAKGQFVLEAEAVARGYKLARQARPDIGLRVLLTQGSYRFNDQVIAALPRDIGITYYDGGRTYDSSRNEMIYPLLEGYVKSGGWLGCYPQLTASWRIVCPWSAPQFIRFRMNEFVDDGLECLCGYATPDNRFYEFNVLAAAEWAWNSKGRDEREFALAYFTHKGVSDPQKAADWAVMLGPVGWDVYGARVPYSWFFGGIAKALDAGNLPTLGQGPFTYMPTEEHLHENLQACAAAMKLAQQVGDEAMLAETNAIEGYVRMLKAIHEMGRIVGKKKELGEQQKASVAGLMGDLDQATLKTTNALGAWQQAVAPDNRAGRFEDTVRVTQETCAAVGQAIDKFGVEDPGKPYRAKQVGRWQTEDFEPGPEIAKTWDVTEAINGPGTYRVQFVYQSGWYGLNIHRTSLASAKTAAPDELQNLATDEHEGTAAYRNKDNIYELSIDAYSPELKYHIVADVRGMPKDSAGDKQGCNGKLMIWKVRPN